MLWFDLVSFAHDPTRSPMQDVWPSKKAMKLSFLEKGLQAMRCIG